MHRRRRPTVAVAGITTSRRLPRADPPRVERLPQALDVRGAFGRHVFLFVRIGRQIIKFDHVGHAVFVGTINFSVPSIHQRYFKFAAGESISTALCSKHSPKIRLRSATAWASSTFRPCISAVGLPPASAKIVGAKSMLLTSSSRRSAAILPGNFSMIGVRKPPSYAIAWTWARIIRLGILQPPIVGDIDN